MGSLGENENVWTYKVETSGKLVTENLGLLPGFHLDPVETPGIYHVRNLTRESAETTALLLQGNHTNYHIFLLPVHSKGSHLHNHIVYLALTLFSLGASLEQLRYVHSIMHVGLALEFKQTKILAEGFAQAAVHHDYWYTDFFRKVDRDVKEASSPALSLSEAIDECRADPAISTCSSVDYQRSFEGEGKNRKFALRREMFKDGVCGKAFDELAVVAARYRVEPNNLERATAEIINTAVHMSASAQYPPHECRVDFFLMHGTNCSIWQTAFLQEPSITNPQKAHLLEYTGRTVLMLYAGMGCPTPRFD